MSASLSSFTGIITGATHSLTTVVKMWNNSGYGSLWFPFEMNYHVCVCVVKVMSMTFSHTLYDMQEPCFLIWIAWTTCRKSVTSVTQQTGLLF